MTLPSSALRTVHDFLCLLQRQYPLPTPFSVMAALSGGEDSIALLVLLKEIEKKHAICAVSAGHVAHNLQHKEAQQHEITVVDTLCKTLNVPLHRAVLKLNERQATLEENAPRRENEEWARDKRYSQLYQLAAENSIAVLATAHHKDDQAETVLMRLLRGDGLRGLSGIPTHRPFQVGCHTGNLFSGLVVRPLLAFSKSELRDLAHRALLTLQIPGSYHSDPGNAEKLFLRSRLRFQTLPAIADLFPEYQNALCSLAEDARQILDDIGHRNFLSQFASSSEAEKSMRRSHRTAFPWFISEDGLQIPREFFLRCTATERMNLLYLGANYMGLRRVPRHFFLPLLAEEIQPASCTIKNTELSITASHILWKSAEADMPEKKSTLFNEYSVETDLQCSFSSYGWNIEAISKKKRKKEAAGIEHLIAYSGNLKITRLKKNDTMIVNSMKMRIRDLLPYEIRRKCIVIKDSRGIIALPAECFLSRTILSDLCKTSSPNGREQSKSYCIMKTAYKAIQFFI